jgi:manganese transport protein
VSFSIPFALVPLVLLTRRADLMGALVNRRAALIIAPSVYLLWSTIARKAAPSEPSVR